MLFLTACKGPQKASDFTFPKPVDTNNREIDYQEKKTYSFPTEGIYASNEYDGARLNNFVVLGKNKAEATISPENTPINHSPYYSFKLWADEAKEVTIDLKYIEHGHRYRPKISSDRKNWTYIDTTMVSTSEDRMTCSIKLNISKEPVYLSAQEIIASGDVKDWCDLQAQKASVHYSSVGKSPMDKDLPCLDIYEGDRMNKDVVIILSRQHPPEVTGYLAMQTFVEEILRDNHLSNTFRKNYRVLVFPLVNPDGVDLGHWRHNTGGIDLNRDWAYYRQKEIRAIADYCVKTSSDYKNDVILGLDFHSTFKDVYYTLAADMDHDINGFREIWLEGIKNQMDGYEPRDAPSGLGGPVSKGWFYQQFKAEGITYEIGDETPREFIDKKGRLSAQEMMKLLIFKSN